MRIFAAVRTAFPRKYPVSCSHPPLMTRLRKCGYQDTSCRCCGYLECWCRVDWSFVSPAPPVPVTATTIATRIHSVFWKWRRSRERDIRAINNSWRRFQQIYESISASHIWIYPLSLENLFLWKSIIFRCFPLTSMENHIYLCASNHYGKYYVFKNCTAQKWEVQFHFYTRFQWLGKWRMKV